LKLCFLSYMASYDVASTIHQSLPEDDIALEVDGPAHFLLTDGGEGSAPGDAARGAGGGGASTRTVRTELRDMFLERRVNAVVSVPWFEWAELNSKAAAAKKEFVAAKLRAAGVRVPA
jgi:hypothetical protein